MKKQIALLYNSILNLSNFNKYDFRFVIFGIISFYIAILFFSEYYFGSYVVIGKQLLISPIPYFVDLRILLCGIDSIRAGLNPYTTFCYDKLTYFNYPYVWGVFSLLPFMTEANLFIIGFSIIFLFFISLYFFIGKCNLLGGIVYTLLFLSPAVMLAVERGNCDLIIFLTIMFALSNRVSRYLFTILLLFVSMLKLFPIGASIAILNKVKKKSSSVLFLLAGLLVAFLLYIIIQKDNILIVSQKTPRPFGTYSYGLGEIPSFIIQLFGVGAATVKVIIYIFLLVFSFIFFYFFLFKKFAIPKIGFNKFGTAYLTGAGIFITTCLIGFNWEYRLIFLLFTIPQLLIWIYERNYLALLSLLFSILLVWQSFIQKILGLVHLDILQYHYISQLFIVFLFYSHLFIIYQYLNSLYKQFSFKLI